MDERKGREGVAAGAQDESDPVLVVVRDSSGWLLGDAVQYDAALTLWASLSEDPHDWQEVAAYWPRYRTPVVAGEVTDLALHASDRETAFRRLGSTADWLLFDLVDKRIFTGREIQLLTPHATLELAPKEASQSYPLPFHLPPWWELHEHVEAEAAKSPRENEPRIPHADRDLLYGDVMLKDLAGRVASVFLEDGIPEGSPEQREVYRALYQKTVEVHRDWLMTPREELAGGKPRDLLHGAHDWCESVIEGQRRRLSAGGTVVAAPKDTYGFSQAPMGREELLMYFHLCRDVIEAGWLWCLKQQQAHRPNNAGDRDAIVRQLIAVMSSAKTSWLKEPFEGGSPPQFVIECSRRRVPCGDNLPIVGMETWEGESHTLDCNCPICDLLHSGVFGPSFSMFTGESLEMDGEFAFSQHETLEAFREEQLLFGDWDEPDDDDLAGIASAAGDEAGAGDEAADEFRSAWSSPMTEGPLPGDPHGHMKLAFRLAEIISDLEFAGASQQTITSVNNAFACYVQQEGGDQRAAAGSLQQQLELTAGQHPELRSKISDFQSLIDERQRVIP
ncbi:hypothetical protein [Roseimaritima sediminicola]|uniref:hypothetical protein n=1 Tax=Roseimaritima sediminicola TaxID=2662066 RepID=UPI0012984E51|nr:hypothetical protein [Roseimaritima sediminicola]